MRLISKLLLLLIVVLNCFYSFQTAYADQVGQELESTVPEHETVEFKGLVNNICAQIKSAKANGTGTLPTDLEKRLLSYKGISKSTPNYQIIVGSFFNKHRNHFICPGGYDYREQHLFSRVIDMNMTDKFFYDFMLSDDFKDYGFDMNVYEFINGKKQTTIDYIELVKQSELYNKSRSYRAKINELAEILIEDYGARRAAELDE